MKLFYEFKNGTKFVIDLDKALTNINYTMDVTPSRLSQIGEQSIQMARDLKTSAENVLNAVTTYANANETAQSILSKSMPTIMLSNVTGMGTSDTTDILQGVINQFDLEDTEKSLYRISDILQAVSQAMPVDFAKGIREIAEGIQASGSVANSAGVSLEQYTAMLGNLIAKTRQSGSELGRSLRTMMVRTTRASSSALAGGEVTLEDLSKAETALRRANVEVRKDAETFRSFEETMTDLASKVDKLSDVDLANIAYEVAGTRQTAAFRVMIKSFADYKELAEQAMNAGEVTMANQEKYAESLQGQLGELEATSQSIWNNIIDTDVLSGGIDLLNGLLSVLNSLVSQFGVLMPLISGVGITAFVKNFSQLKDLGNLSIALKSIKQLPTDFNAVSNAVSVLDKEQLITALSASKLNEADLGLLLTSKGLKDAELENALATITLAQSQKTATASTKEYGLAFKGLGASIKKLALTHPILTAIVGVGVAIGAGIKIYDALTISVDEATEALDEFRAKHDEINNSLNSKKKTVEELADSYDKLSKGVSVVNGELQNVSLTDDDYKSFVEMNQTLAETFPQLVEGIDNNGLSILNLGKHAKTSRKELEELLQKEEELSNYRIAQDAEDEFENTNVLLEDYSDKIKDVTTEIENSQKAFDKIKDIAQNGLSVDSIIEFKPVLTSEADKQFQEMIIKARDELLDSISGNDDKRIILNAFTQSNGFLDLSKLVTPHYNGDELQKRFIDIINSLAPTVEREINDTIGDLYNKLDLNQGDLESTFRDFIPTIVATMKSKQGYKDLSDAGKEIADTLADSLDYSIRDDLEEQGIANYVRKNIVDQVKKISDDDKIQLLDLIDNNEEDLSPVQLKNIVTGLQEQFDKSDVNINLDFLVDDELVAKYRRTLVLAKSKFGEDLTEFFEKNSINTREEIDTWIEIAERCKEATQAKEEYLNTSIVDENEYTPLSISDTISQLDERLSPTFKSLKSAYQDIFKLDDDKNLIFSLDELDITSTLSDIKSSLDKINEIEGIDLDYSSFEDFARVLSNTESTSDDVQKAFNTLASSITDSAVTGTEDFKILKSALEDLGIVNNEIIAFKALASNTEALKDAGIDLTNATYDEIEAFVNEMVAAENATQAIQILTNEKFLNNLQSISTEKDVAELKTFAENAGYTGDVIKNLIKLKQIYQSVSSGNLSDNEIAIRMNEASVLKQEIEGLASKVKYNPLVDYTVKIDKPNKPSSPSKQAKDTVESFDFIDRKINSIQKTIDKLDKKVGNTYKSWSSRNKTLVKEIGKLNDLYNTQTEASAYYNKKANSISFTTAQSKNILTDSEIKSAIDGVVGNKNIEKALNKAIRSKVKNGAIDIKNIKDETTIKKLKELQDYTDKAEKMTENASDTYDKYYEAIQSKLELTTKKYDAQVELLESRKNRLQNKIDLIEAVGGETDFGLYINQIKINNSEITKLAEKRQEMLAVLAKTPKYSEEWYELSEQLYDIENQMDSLKLSNIEFQKVINQIKFDKFDELQDKLSGIIDEAGFLVELLSNTDLFDKNGNITDNGIGALGMYGSQYNVAMSQADLYGEEIEKLNQALADGTIYQSEYDEKIKDLVSGHQDAILSAEGYKKAMIDLVRDGINKQNEALRENVELQKEELRRERELFEYQESIRSKSKKITDLQKQLNVLSGDNSEENQKKLRELKAQLAEAQKDYDDTVYDRSITNQENALDSMYDNAVKQSEEYLADSDKVLVDALAIVNANSSTVTTAIQDVARKTGYVISNELVNGWKDSGTALSNYNDTFTVASSTMVSNINSIASAYENMAEKAQAAAIQAQNAVSQTSNVSTSDGKHNGIGGNDVGTDSYGLTQKVTDFINDNKRKSNTTYGKHSKLVQYVWKQLGGQTNENSTGGYTLSYEAQKGLAKLLGVTVAGKQPTVAEKNKILEALKKAGFASGGIINASNSNSALKKFTGEDGFALVSHGEAILTKEQTEAMKKVSTMFPKMNDILSSMQNIKASSNLGNSVYHIDNSINVDGIATEEVLKQAERTSQNQIDNAFRKVNELSRSKYNYTGKRTL